MGLTLKLTDEEIPASPSFIEFLYAFIRGEEYYAGEWYLQEEESLTRNDGRFKGIEEMSHFVSHDKLGKAAILRSYRFFRELLTGRIETLRTIENFHYLFVVGMPRTGGTYLTKQLFRALGHDYKKVQNALAHDGFPHLINISIREKGNLQTSGLLQLSEYLTMVELYFGRPDGKCYEGKLAVPKKFTKGVYSFDLIKEVFKGSASYLITIRHPLAVCQSVIDKSGGLPKDGRFAVRSIIERWAMEAWLHLGYGERDVFSMDYVDVLLGYWRSYHYQMAMSGMPSLPSSRIIPYGAEAMNQVSRDVFASMGVDVEPETFFEASAPEFDEKYLKAANKLINDMTAFWRSLGMSFPKKQQVYRYLVKDFGTSQSPKSFTR
ncbi:MAG: hypothetical protein G8D28_05615 [gamma proteobacterium symbiont of Phacoides pectinatus]